MSDKLLPPPQPEVCLTKSYVSRGVKGGTVIVEDVWGREVHRQKLLDPDDYRGYIGPCRNPDCDGAKVHAHCFRTRLLYPADTGDSVGKEDIRLYRCPKESCGAVYTVLPAFLAPHLWRDWQTVEEVCDGKRKAPRTTTRRWCTRLASSARQLVQLFKGRVVNTLKGSVDWLRALSENLPRGGFINVLRFSGSIPPRNTFAQIAAWIHQIEPGVRLM